MRGSLWQQGVNQRLVDAVLTILAQVNAHPKVVNSPYRLVAYEGERGLARQESLVAEGVSETLHSKHLRQKDGTAHAVDCAWHGPYGLTWQVGALWGVYGYHAEKMGLLWGGRWGTNRLARHRQAHAGMELGWDPAHVELPDKET